MWGWLSLCASAADTNIAYDFDSVLDEVEFEEASSGDRSHIKVGNHHRSHSCEVSMQQEFWDAPPESISHSPASAISISSKGDTPPTRAMHHQNRGQLPLAPDLGQEYQIPSVAPASRVRMMGQQQGTVVNSRSTSAGSYLPAYIESPSSVSSNHTPAISVRSTKTFRILG